MKKLKVFLCLITVLSLVYSLSFISVNAAGKYDWLLGTDYYKFNGVYFSAEVKNNGAWFYVVSKDNKLGEIASIIAYNGEEANVVIPENIDGYPVTEIFLKDSGYYTEEKRSYFPVFDTKIESLTLPKTIEYIRAFVSDSWSYLEKPDKKGDYCLQEWFIHSMLELEEIIVNKENKYFSSEDGVLFSKDKKTLINYPCNKKDKEYIVPKTVTNIYEGAFWGVLKYGADEEKYGTHLKKLTITENVEKIEMFAGNNGGTTSFENLVIRNVKITKNMLKSNIMARKEIVVYENSPAHKYYKSYIDKNEYDLENMIYLKK